MEKPSMFAGLFFVLLLSPAFCQTETAPHPDTEPAQARSTYILGPDDLLAVRVVDADDLGEKSIRVGADGTINLPMVGRIRAAGLTPDDLEKQIVLKLKPFIRQPEVTINVVEMRSQPVSVIGQVGTPGVQQLQGRKTLVELLSAVGGPTEKAGNSLIITRQKEWGPIPLPGAKVDPSGDFSVAEINLRDLMDARDPATNILIMPKDVISVPKAQVVYVIGDVKRAGGFVINDRGLISVLQALSMANGCEKTAAQSSARILRITDPNDRLKRTEIPVNLKAMLSGKAEDLAMRPEDILVVPGSKSRSAAIKALEMAAQIGTGIAIFRTQ